MSTRLRPTLHTANRRPRTATLSIPLPAVEIPLQDQQSCHTVPHLLAPLSPDPRLDQRPVRGDRGVPFIPQDHRKPQGILQLCGKFLRPDGLLPDLTSQVPGIPDDDLVDSPFFDEVPEMGEIRPPAHAAPSRQRLGGDHEIVTHRQAHANLAKINGQNPRHAPPPPGEPPRVINASNGRPCPNNQVIIQEDGAGCYLHATPPPMTDHGGRLHAAPTPEHLSPALQTTRPPGLVAWTKPIRGHRRGHSHPEYQLGQRREGDPTAPRGTGAHPLGHVSPLKTSLGHADPPRRDLRREDPTAPKLPRLSPHALRRPRAP